MQVFELFSWWYTQGWGLLSKNMYRRLIRTSQLFSMPILLRTLFAPWRRIITYPGTSIQTKLQASVDNLVSRMVGFVVRLLVLLVAIIMLGLISLIACIELLAWPLLPLVIVGFLIKAVIG